mmetsp:Transcript_96431/g.267934  ORF Transcript_96431/g.267934 Transcript_96431/m.267934 type:complete len:86 (+) Transcript_96431:506-763(+)
MRFTKHLRTVGQISQTKKMIDGCGMSLVLIYPSLRIEMKSVCIHPVTWQQWDAVGVKKVLIGTSPTHALRLAQFRQGGAPKQKLL